MFFSVDSVAGHPTINNKLLTPTFVTTTVNSQFTFTSVYLNLMQTLNWTTIVDIGGNPFFPDLAGIARKKLEKYPHAQIDFIEINSAQFVNNTQILHRFNFFSRGTSKNHYCW